MATTYHDADSIFARHPGAPRTGTWDGGNEPFKASYGKLMMWFFLLSDAFTFAAFLTTYGLMRHRHVALHWYQTRHLSSQQLIGPFRIRYSMLSQACMAWICLWLSWP